MTTASACPNRSICDGALGADSSVGFDAPGEQNFLRKPKWTFNKTLIKKNHYFLEYANKTIKQSKFISLSIILYGPIYIYTLKLKTLIYFTHKKHLNCPSWLKMWGVVLTSKLVRSKDADNVVFSWVKLSTHNISDCIQLKNYNQNFVYINE